MPVNYRTGSQKGGKPRRALLYETTAAGPLLEGLHGEPVTLRETDPVVVEVEAVEVVAAVVEPTEVVDPVVVEVVDPPVVPPAPVVPGTGAAHIPTYAMPTHLHDLYAAIRDATAKLVAESAGRLVATP